MRERVVVESERERRVRQTNRAMGEEETKGYQQTAVE